MEQIQINIRTEELRILFTNAFKLWPRMTNTCSFSRDDCTLFTVRSYGAFQVKFWEYF